VAESSQDVLLVRAGARVCALPIADVAETMRPLPTAPLAGTPPYVTGAAIARGVASPVVDLDALLAGSAGFGVPGDRAGADARYVRLRCGGRSALLAVEAVLGVSRLAIRGGDAPPLLSAAAGGVVESLGALDGALLLVLRASRLVPEEAVRAIGAGETA
jgi:purine-binding chemotaxis protein CheW